ncbi:MAG: 5'-nucleotidase C-terminal domain-containing protein [Eggerthellaceae bacterium]|nr:5'-nucleotidase C-terminal domain-containing protein [Eggerthellaceae bacterium]
MTDRIEGVHITRRSFLKGVGLVAVGAGLGLPGCSTATGSGAGASSQATGASASASSGGQATPLLAIIHTNDTHGHDMEVAATANSEGNFSMAAIPQLKADWEAKGYEVLIVDSGDATQGTPLVDQSNGEAGITFMNACGYAAMAVGNHEFDRGPDELAAYEKLAEFPLLSANVLDAKTGELRFKPNTIVELVGGTKVGLFGLTTPSTMTTTKPAMNKDFRFLGGEELYECAQKQVDELRAQGADLVVCLGHLGNTELCKPSTSIEVLNNVKGIDLFLDGHDHELVEQEVAGTLLVETGCYMHNIGLVAIDEGMPANNSIAYGSYDGVDAPAQKVIDDANDQVSEELAVALGHTDFFLDGERDPGLRTQETNLGDFCTDAYRWAAEQTTGKAVDAAILNAGGIRASVEVGDISLGDIKTVFPFVDQVCVVNVTGAQLLEVLEAGYQGAGSEPIGAFPQVSGIELTVNATVPYEKGELYPDSTFYGPAKPGSRVTIHSVGGREWKADERYSIAAGDFICQGGDTYYALKQAADAETPIMCDFDYEALSGYLVVACDHEVPKEYSEPRDRIRIVK